MGAMLFSLKENFRNSNCGTDPKILERSTNRKLFEKLANAHGSSTSTLSKEIAAEPKFAEAVRFAEKLCGVELNPEMKIVYVQKSSQSSRAFFAGHSDDAYFVFNLPLRQYTAAHEAVHACDDKLGLAMVDDDERSPWKLIGKIIAGMGYAEGRAAYAVSLFSDAGKAWVALRMYIVKKAYSIFTAIIATVCILLPVAPVFITFGAIQAFIAYDYLNNKRYIPFYLAIGKIAKEIGDPVVAFQITAAKVPSTMRELKNPLKFYKDEIAAAKAAKADAPA